jgi:predicted nucleic acid-binding protein
MKRSQPALIERMKAFAPRDLKASVITPFENIEILAWTESAAREAGAARADLASIGSPIGAYDLQIAGHVRSLGATLVTNNHREFSRVSGLLLADWVSGADSSTSTRSNR